MAQRLVPTAWVAKAFAARVISAESSDGSAEAEYVSVALLKCRTVARAALRSPPPEEDATVQFVNAEDVPTFPDRSIPRPSWNRASLTSLLSFRSRRRVPLLRGHLPEHAALKGRIENIEMSVASMRNLLEGYFGPPPASASDYPPRNRPRALRRCPQLLGLASQLGGLLSQPAQPKPAASGQRWPAARQLLAWKRRGWSGSSTSSRARVGGCPPNLQAPPPRAWPQRPCWWQTPPWTSSATPTERSCPPTARGSRAAVSRASGAGADARREPVGFESHDAEHGPARSRSRGPLRFNGLGELLRHFLRKGAVARRALAEAVTFRPAAIYGAVELLMREAIQRGPASQSAGSGSDLAGDAKPVRLPGASFAGDELPQHGVLAVAAGRHPQGADRREARGRSRSGGSGSGRWGAVLHGPGLVDPCLGGMDEPPFESFSRHSTDPNQLHRSKLIDPRWLGVHFSTLRDRDEMQERIRRLQGSKRPPPTHPQGDDGSAKANAKWRPPPKSAPKAKPPPLKVAPEAPAA